MREVPAVRVGREVVVEDVVSTRVPKVVSHIEGFIGLLQSGSYFVITISPAAHLYEELQSY